MKAELIGAKMVMLTFAAARELVYPVFCIKELLSCRNIAKQHLTCVVIKCEMAKREGYLPERPKQVISIAMQSMSL